MSVTIFTPSSKEPTPHQHAVNNMKRASYAGRRVGSIAGAHIDTLAAQHKAIVLCYGCAPKFNAKAYHYFVEKKVPVTGLCDGCRAPGNQHVMHVHESLLGVSWRPR